MKKLPDPKEPEAMRKLWTFFTVGYCEQEEILEHPVIDLMLLSLDPDYFPRKSGDAEERRFRNIVVQVASRHDNAGCLCTFSFCHDGSVLLTYFPEPAVEKYVIDNSGRVGKDYGEVLSQPNDPECRVKYFTWEAGFMALRFIMTRLLNDIDRWASNQLKKFEPPPP